MSNKITEKYFVQKNLADYEKTILDEIIARTNFKLEKEIFRGRIYDLEKVGSLIFKGSWRDKPVVLKIQGLQPEIDEIDMIGLFNGQNKSRKIRLPKLYDGSKWNEEDGFGFLVLEHIDAPRIYGPSFANTKEIKEFCTLYQEYKTKCLNRPFFAREANEASSLVFTAQRVSHWAKMAEDQGSLAEDDVKIVEKFLVLAGKHLPNIKMEFMHGHFTYDDIFKISKNEYVLMSNLFWSYRPEFYDAAFNLWAGIKSIRDLNVIDGQVIKYFNVWIREYKRLSVIKKDADFERKFYVAMAERCVGAMLLDVRNQNYAKNESKYVVHLLKLFRELFEYFCGKLK